MEAAWRRVSDIWQAQRELRREAIVNRHKKRQAEEELAAATAAGQLDRLKGRWVLWACGKGVLYEASEE
jgi:hypothetical protein